MMRSLKRKLRSTKGQIGQILVVIVLIILAIMGVVQYIMPMFDKSKGLANASNDQIGKLTDDAVKSRYGKIGDKVPGQTVIGTWNDTCNDTETQVIWVNTTTEHSQTLNNTTATYSVFSAPLIAEERVNEMGTYEVILIESHSNSKLKTIKYKLINSI